MNALREKKLKTLILILLLCSAMLSACSKKMPEETPAPTLETPEPVPAAPEEDSHSVLERTIQRDGQTLRYNSRLRTVLFMGVDSKAEVENHLIVGDGGRSDTLILFVIDPDSETMRMIPISRDTMTNVDIYDQNGEYLFSGNMQITMQYAFGNSPARSCQLTKRAVSQILCGLPISSYCSITLDGLAAAVELTNGITLTLEHDWTDINPEYTAGKTVTMDAETVERFLRYRDIETLGSNNIRMQRHSWFIMQVFSQLGKSSRLEVDALLKYLDEYIETDMDAETMKQFASYKIQDEAVPIPGKNVAGETHDEFYIDEDAMKEMLIGIFYSPVN